MIKEAKISDYDIIAQIDEDSNKNQLENEQLNNIREALTNYSKVVFIEFTKTRFQWHMHNAHYKTKIYLQLDI